MPTIRECPTCHNLYRTDVRNCEPPPVGCGRYLLDVPTLELTHEELYFHPKQRKIRLEAEMTDGRAGGETGLSHRYKDAYRVAGAIIAFGTTVKIVGAVVAAVVALAALTAADPLGGGAVVAGTVIAGMTGLAFWIAGVFLTALGQLLRASLDTAVNISPLLRNGEKAEIMGIRVSAEASVAQHSVDYDFVCTNCSATFHDARDAYTHVADRHGIEPLYVSDHVKARRSSPA